MALTAGTRLGPYEIQSAIGAGGMGEVYRARDTRLDRIVAIKVLPAHLASDSQFRQRFEHEARAISALDHPNICALYDVGEDHNTAFLVMQYLEGETLADRLKKGAVPLDQALSYATQIADALDKAHRAGIVHRDLKPGNVMLTKSSAKLLDFGLAKAGAAVASGTGLSMLPTTPAGLTAQGTILGTFQYMAPEQLEGKDADARTDLFAFGAVLYEMLTGKKAFEGKSHASLISAIMSAQPAPVSSVQRLTPLALDQLIARCLAKDPDDRWQSARDVKLQLAWIAESGSGATPALVVAKRGSRERVAWTLAVFAVLGLMGAVATLLRRAPSPESEATQFVVMPPDKGSFGPGSVVPDFAISPDGRQLAFVASSADATSRLWLRPLASVTARPLAGTEFAAGPFWSADGRSIGFFATGKLKAVDVAGGTAQTLADASFPIGGTWNRDGVIVFCPDLAHPLLRVAASGGPTAPVTSRDQPAPGSVHGAPSFLPDGRHFLFTVFRGPSTGSVYVGSLDSREIMPVVNALTAIYSSPGYLLFPRDPKVMAQPFDVSRLSTSGDAVPVADVGGSLSPFHASQSGALVYRFGAAAQTQLVWVDRAGRTIGVAAPQGAYGNVALSPDDQRISFDRLSPASNDVWLMDLQRRITSRFTFQPPNNNVSVWSPDGRTVAFASSRGAAGGNLAEGLDIYQRPSNASAPDELLLKLNVPPIMFPSDWSSDGRFITYYRSDPKTQLDEWVLPLFGDRKPFALLHSEFNESQGQFSPDGKFIAYVSDESGGPQVYVQAFPTLTGRWQVSTNGGRQPRWNRNGKELFYLGPDRKLMLVTVKAGAATFDADAPRALFDTSLEIGALRQTYSVSSDGQRFLLNTPVDTTSSPLTVVLNWPALLRK